MSRQLNHKLLAQLLFFAALPIGAWADDATSHSPSADNSASAAFHQQPPHSAPPTPASPERPQPGAAPPPADTPPKPPWAFRHGQDQYGRWADMDLYGIQVRMRLIQPGRFQMGSPSTEHGRAKDETSHPVVLSSAFWLSETEVSQALWATFMPHNPSQFVHPDLPVEHTHWPEVVRFLWELNATRPTNQLRLPTEAEWEYAARAGTRGMRHGPLDTIAWYTGNSGQRTHPGCQQARNAVGLCDMLGNVWEWCSDWYGPYPAGKSTNPIGRSGGQYRSIRGGSWADPASTIRAAFRGGGNPGLRSKSSIGLRLARSYRTTATAQCQGYKSSHHCPPPNGAY